MTDPSFDASIPLLTEVFDPAAAGAPRKPAASRAPQSETAPMPPLAGAAEPEWSRMEREISERVLQQLLGRVDFVLDQRVRDSLADTLQTAVQGLAAEIRAGLQQTLEEVVARAVTQEIGRLQSHRK